MFHKYRRPTKLVSASVRIPVMSAYRAHLLSSLSHTYISFCTLLASHPCPNSRRWGRIISVHVRCQTKLLAWRAVKEMRGKIRSSRNQGQSFIYRRQRKTRTIEILRPSFAQIARRRSPRGFNFRKPGLELRQILQATATTKSKRNQLNDERATKRNTHQDGQEMLEPMCHCVSPSSLSYTPANLLTPISRPSLSRNLQDRWRDHWE